MIPAARLPIRIQLSRKKGWRMPPNTVNVARPGKWGNPYKVSDTCNAKHAVLLHRNRIIGLLEIGAIDLTPLRGKNVACWCKFDAFCHGDTLLELANK